MVNTNVVKQFFLSFQLVVRIKPWPRRMTCTLIWPMLARVKESMSSSIKNPHLTVTHVPVAAVVGAASPRPRAAAAKGDGTGLHRQRRHLPGAGPLILDPALTLGVTEPLRVVAVKTTPGTSVGGTVAHHPTAAGPATIPVPVHPPRTDTRATEVIGPAPDHTPGHRGIRAGVETGSW